MLFLADHFLFLHDTTWLLQRIESIFYLFLLIGFTVGSFLSNQENLYMIHRNSILFYDICNTINESNRRQTHIFFYNFLCFIINHDFCVVTFWMHYTLFIRIIFKRNKINCYCWLNFPRVKFFEIIYDIFFQEWSNLVKIFLCVIVLFYHLYFYIQNNFYSKNYWLIYWFIYWITLYWFIRISFFMFKVIPSVCNYFVFNCFVFFFWSKRVIVSLIAALFVSFFSFFNLKRFLISLVMSSSKFYILQALHFSSLYVVKKSIYVFWIKIYYTP